MRLFPRAEIVTIEGAGHWVHSDKPDELAKVVEEFGSFQNYLKSFEPESSFGNVERLKDNLQRRFRYLGNIISYHLMMDLGVPINLNSLSFFKVGCSGTGN
jgi:hypothetical protein